MWQRGPSHKESVLAIADVRSCSGNQVMAAIQMVVSTKPNTKATNGTYLRVDNIFRHPFHFLMRKECGVAVVACDDPASVKHPKKVPNACLLLARLFGLRWMEPLIRSPSNLNERKDRLVTSSAIVGD